jgi:hypothetical protein
MNYRTCTSLLEIKPADPRPVPTALHAHRTTSTTRTEHDTGPRDRHQLVLSVRHAHHVCDEQPPYRAADLATRRSVLTIRGARAGRSEQYALVTSAGVDKAA